MYVVAVFQSIALACVSAMVAIAGLGIAAADRDSVWPGLAAVAIAGTCCTAAIAFLRGSRHARLFLAGLHVVGAISLGVAAPAVGLFRDDNFLIALLIALAWCTLGAFAFVSRSARRKTGEFV